MHAGAKQGWPGVWRGHDMRRDIPVLPTGHEALDRLLPGGGWPLGALSELLTEAPGSGEFRLLLPALGHLTRQGRWVILVNPPWVPYPPAMRGHGVALEQVMLVHAGTARESLWACEQALRGIDAGAVLAWPENPGFAHLRRLQLAARSNQQAAFLFRPLRAGRQPSPAALRLRLNCEPGGTCVTVLKSQGGRAGGAARIRCAPCLPGQAGVCTDAPATLANQWPLPGTKPLAVAGAPLQ